LKSVEKVGFVVTLQLSIVPTTRRARSTDRDHACISGRSAIIWNVAPPLETLTVMANNSNAGVRSAVAWTATTPPDLLALLAKDPNASVRSGVAGNTAPPDLLALLANDANASVRSAVAWNGATLPEDLWLLQSGGRSFCQMIVRRIFAISGATSPDGTVRAISRAVFGCGSFRP
jgi:hypothetical protein